MCMFLQLTSLAPNLHHNQKLQFLQRPGLTGSFIQRSGVWTVHNPSYKVVANVSSFVLPCLLNSDKNYTGDWKQRFSSLLCLNGLNLNLLPGWVCRAVPGALCWGSTTVAERNGEEVAWSADPRWMLAPCSSPVLWGVRQAGGSLSLTNHVWVAFLNAVSTTLFCAGSPGSLWGGWQSHCSFRVFVYLLLCSQCFGAFLLQVLTPCRSGKATELSWSLLSAPAMRSKFLQASGKCFFPTVFLILYLSVDVTSQPQ